MGLEELKQKIIEDAKRNAAEIIKTGESKTTLIIKEAQEKIKKLREERLRKAELEAKAIKERTVGSARLEARKKLLLAKQELIEEVITKALKRILELPKKEYLKFIEKQLLGIEDLSGSCKVEFNERDKRIITPEWLEKLEQELRKKSPNLSLELSKNFRTDITGGVIIKSSEVELNNSLEAIVKLKRDDLECEIANILFGAQK